MTNCLNTLVDTDDMPVIVILPEISDVVPNNERLPEYKKELDSQINVHAARSMSTSLKYNPKYLLFISLKICVCTNIVK